MKALLIAGLCDLSNDLTLVDILFQRQQNLIGVDGLDQIVGYFAADGLVHDVFLLAAGYHDHGSGRLNLLDLLQGFESGDAWHHLVEQDKVVSALPTSPMASAPLVTVST